MRITVTQSGRLAGLDETRIALLDTDRLHAQAAGRVRGRLAAAGFFSLPEHVVGGTGADRLRYRIVAEEDGQRHAVAFEDDGSPAAVSLRALVDALVEEAGAQANS